MVRRWFESVIRSNLGQGLTREQEVVVSVLATARSQGLEIFITLETYNILTRILRNPHIARAIIANCDVLYPSKPFKRWVRNVKDATNMMGEDAKVLAYATFGTNIAGTILGCEKLLTLDKGIAHEFELKKKRMDNRLGHLKKRLPVPYQKAELPEIVLLDAE